MFTELAPGEGVRLIVTTSAVCSYLTFIPSACIIAGRSSHPDIQLWAHSRNNSI